MSDNSYQGYREGKGIWGRWEIGLLGHGGFHIWPKGSQEGNSEVAAKEATASAEAIDLLAGCVAGEAASNRNAGEPLS